MGKKNAKPVYQIDIVTFDIISRENAVTTMARKLGIGPTHISDICNKKAGTFTAKGCTFCFVKDYNRVELEERLNTKRPNTKKEIRVFYFDRDMKEIGIFPSYYEASKVLSIGAGNLSECARGKRQIAGYKDFMLNGERISRPVACEFVNAVNREESPKIGIMDMVEKNKGSIELYAIKTNEVLETYITLEKAFEELNHKNRSLLINCLMGIKVGFVKNGKLVSYRYASIEAIPPHNTPSEA
jgi:hypothetical protein